MPSMLQRIAKLTDAQLKEAAATLRGVTANDLLFVREAVAMEHERRSSRKRGHGRRRGAGASEGRGAVKYSHIDFTPPAGVREEAAKGLAWRREHGRGGTAVGVARARDLSNGVKISPETAKRMKAFFDRHQVNKGKEGWSPGEKKFPSNARIAWALWGSDAGWSWSRKLVSQMNTADEKAKRDLRTFLEKRAGGQ